jgi:hypothetical protein
MFCGAEGNQYNIFKIFLIKTCVMCVMKAISFHIIVTGGAVCQFLTSCPIFGVNANIAICKMAHKYSSVIHTLILYLFFLIRENFFSQICMLMPVLRKCCFQRPSKVVYSDNLTNQVIQKAS